MARVHSDDNNNQFQKQVNTLASAFNLIFDESRKLTSDQSMYQAGASDAMKNGKFCISKAHMGEQLNPFQVMVNDLLKKGIISQSDTMASFGKRLVEHQDQLDKNTVNLIFIAANRVGVLTQDPQKYTEVLKAARLSFNQVVAFNEKKKAAEAQKAVVQVMKNPASQTTEVPVSNKTDESLMAALRRVSEIKDLKSYQAGIKDVLSKMRDGHYPGTIQHDEKESNTSELPASYKP